MLGVFTKKPVGEQACFVPIIAVLNEGIQLPFVQDSFFIFISSMSFRR